ncbi:MAG: hypothetical protein GTN78_13630 [Gemmatimonadales bacterium]|nr:hypothetical protein [Gemmatimonadales bacterium]NIR01218.1 hypothetical protein [Gemmatimonadales bacterium]NIS65241.1 hypothetical protein [Gemmatimonadales bacterium]
MKKPSPKRGQRAKRARRATKAEQLEASIAELVRASERDAGIGPGDDAIPSSGGSVVLSQDSPELAAGEYLIAVADAHSVALRRMRAAVDASDEDARSVLEKWATRLAEIELAVAELARADLIPDPGRVADRTPGEDRLLEQGGFELAEPSPDVIDPVSRATAEFARLVSDSYTTEEAGDILGVNSSRVRQRLGGERRTLLGVKLGNSWRVPRFQFLRKKLVPGLDKVVAELSPELHPVAVYRWFTTPCPDLVHDDLDERPVSPLDWLKMGNPPGPVAELAANL